VWLRHNLQTFQLRLKALEKRIADNGEVFTESQLKALEKSNEEKIACGAGPIRFDRRKGVLKIIS
jgi:hypothetical protein